MDQQVLGTHKAKFLFTCQGTLPPDRMREVGNNLIRFAGMTIAREHPIDEYPLEGKGGNGYTLFQPLVESYLVSDVYIDINETEILLSTCIPERLLLEALVMFLNKELGPTVGERIK